MITGCPGSGQVLIDDVCACPGNQVFSNNVCNCPNQGQIADTTTGICACPGGQELNNNVCTDLSMLKHLQYKYYTNLTLSFVTTGCDGSGQVIIDGACSCRENQELVSNVCSCPAQGQVADTTTGICACPGNQILNNNICSNPSMVKH